MYSMEALKKCVVINYVGKSFKDLGITKLLLFIQNNNFPISEWLKLLA